MTTIAYSQRNFIMKSQTLQKFSYAFQRKSKYIGYLSKTNNRKTFPINYNSSGNGSWGKKYIEIWFMAWPVDLANKFKWKAKILTKKSFPGKPPTRCQAHT